MLKYANKVIFRYLILLVVIISLGAVVFVLSRVYIGSIFDNLDNQLHLVQSDVDKIEKIGYKLEKIKADLFSLSANTSEKKKREIILDEIKAKSNEIEITINDFPFTLNQKFMASYGITANFSNDFMSVLDLIPPMLQAMLEKNEQLVQLLEIRDRMLNEKNSKILNLSKEIRNFNAEIPSNIESIKRLVAKAKSQLEVDEKLFEESIEKKRDEYFQIQMIIYLIAFVIILILVRVISMHILNLYRRVENRLFIDELTTLGSRYAFLHNLNLSQNPAVILVDIDKFRSINELFGLECGNEVLQKLAKIMREFAKNNDCDVFRLSADEFAFLKECEGCSSEYLEKLAYDFHEYYKGHLIYIDLISDTIELEFSFGIYLGKESALSKADMALEHAKSNNILCKVYTSEIDTLKSLKHNVFWKKEIKEAIEHDNFVPFFQPIVDKDGQIVRYEALARMKRVENGEITFIPPAKFLEIAIKTKYYNIISKMVIFQALEVCKRQNVHISLNIGKKDILNYKFLQELKKKIQDYNIAELLTFEIIECEDVSGNRHLKNFLNEFKELGVSFALDDFGSGFSNFAFILEVSPELIKIDGTLIRHIDIDHNSYELVKSIVAFSHALGKKVVAEFVHSKEVFDIVKELNVDFFQGYYFSEPLQKI